ncbi:MAG TPA: ABC transporter substrate-binding protein [Gammaproteobacteria bacterium]|nr:ABC transporter substrate-binding protein [Gammaproteobacteria bacterium]
MRERLKPGCIAVAAWSVAALSCSGDPPAHGQGLGEPGDPIELVVGYQPYYTEAWSAVVVRGLGLHERYLPRGSTVEFRVGLKGARILVDALRAGEIHAAYLGIAPAVTAIGEADAGDMRAIAVTGLAYDQCNILVARADAPAFGDAAEALRWLEGRRLAIPSGTCADLFARRILDAAAVTPSLILDQNIDVIGHGFETGAIDAAAVWEPAASRLVESGLVRRLVTGVAYDCLSAGFLVVRADLATRRPDVVRAWLEAELDAQLVLADPSRRSQVIELVDAQTTGYSAAQLHRALYGPYAADAGGSDPRLVYPFAFTPQVTSMLQGAAAWLLGSGDADHPALRPEAVAPEPADALLRKRGLHAPVGTISAIDVPANGVGI